MNRQKLYFKILGAVIVGYYMAELFNKHIFLANTPKIRNNLADYIASKFSESANLIVNVVKNKKNISTFTFKEDLNKIPFETISQGVYAKGNGNITYVLIKTGEVEWLEYTFNINGKQIKIKVPKGENPPSQEIVEKMTK